MGGHLLGEAPDGYPRRGQGLRRFLDEDGVSHSDRRLSRATVAEPGNRRDHARHRDPSQLAHHESRKWRTTGPQSVSRTQRLGLGRRRWDRRRGNLDRRRPELAPGDARTRAGTLCVARLPLAPGYTQGGAGQHSGARRQPLRSTPTRPAHAESIRLPSQSGAECLAGGRVKRLHPALAAVAMLALACSAPRPAAAGEETIGLTDAPGREITLASCGVCHSLDYLPINAPGMNYAGLGKSLPQNGDKVWAPINA